VTRPAGPSESILVFSDVHLGSDLNDAGPHVPRSVSVDRDLASLLVHYRGVVPPADRWRIVIAGDFIDFVGMSIDPRDGEELETPLTDEERRNGVGSAEDHARLKLRRVVHRHAEVFEQLGRFVAAGHALTVLHGNHDIELHWDGLKADFRDVVASHAPEEARASVRDRIDFVPWFFYRENVCYIEHGHQYDPFCATSFILSPLCPRDPRRVERGFSETLLRTIVRRTPGLKEHGHEDRGLASYVGWGLTLGVSGTAALFGRFFRAVYDLLHRQGAYGSEIGTRLRAEHDTRLLVLAEQTGLGEARLRALLELQSRPIAATFRGVLASVMLDRLAVGLLVAVLLAVIALLVRIGPLEGHGGLAVGVVLAIWVALHFYLSRGRGSVDPAKQMIDRATHLARLFGTPFVVMGHTHVPVSLPAGRSTYINVGSWAEEEPEPRPPGADPAAPHGYRAARTHLVIHERDGGAEAHFFEWHADDGPRLRA